MEPDGLKLGVLPRHKRPPCGSIGPNLHVHHRVPVAAGGTNSVANTLCEACHVLTHSRVLS